MATWAFYGWTSGDSTAAGASSALALDSSSALSFGGGTRPDFQSNISLNSWNSAMHFAQDTAESSVDMCTDSHLWPIYPTGTFDTGAVMDGVYTNMASGTPDPARGIGLRFTHGFGVVTNPVTIWGGTGGDVSGYPENCNIAIASLTSANPTWATTSPVTKYSLESQPSADEHWWSVAIAVQPTVVGHTGVNKIMVECTYY